MEEENHLVLDIDKKQKIIYIDVKDAIYIIEQNKKQCIFCGIKGKMLKCANCIGAYYCSKKCQKLHYKDHKNNCNKDNYFYDIGFKQNVYFNRTLSCYFLANILKIENSPFLPKKWFRYKFWKIHYFEDMALFAFEVMPHDELELCKASLFKKYSFLENDDTYKCVRDEEMESNYILGF